MSTIADRERELQAVQDRYADVRQQVIDLVDQYAIADGIQKEASARKKKAKEGLLVLRDLKDVSIFGGTGHIISFTTTTRTTWDMERAIDDHADCPTYFDDYRVESESLRLNLLERR